jgi:hypothetical protein
MSRHTKKNNELRGQLRRWTSDPMMKPKHDQQTPPTKPPQKPPQSPPTTPTGGPGKQD